jgi:hypothetical protein
MGLLGWFRGGSVRGRFILRRWLGFAAIWAILLAACSAHMPPESNRRSAFDLEYQTVLEGWTAQTTVYQNLDNTLYVAATYKSPAFREAYTRKYARDYKLTPDDARRMQVDQRTVAAGYHEFIVAVAAPDKRDLDIMSRKSPWRVYLEGAGPAPIEPFEVRPVAKDARMESFFPYITPWTRVYQVRFVASGPDPAQRELNLVITGVLGTARLVYRAAH